MGPAERLGRGALPLMGGNARRLARVSPWGVVTYGTVPMGDGRRKSQNVTTRAGEKGRYGTIGRRADTVGSDLEVDNRPGSADGGIGRDGLPLLVAGA